MSQPWKALRWTAAAAVGALTAGLLALAAVYAYIAPDLPSIDNLRDVQLQVPLRVYTREGRLIGEYGEKRRVPVAYEEFPSLLVKAFLAAEDDRFFEHPGVDYQGLLRAAIELARTGEKRQGGSTITMQVARNFFLSREKTYLRKVREIFLALKIERELDKPEILELYLNKIYLGHRAYGVGAAARVYYGRDVDGLSLAQMAMIAGLPKAPSANNPITDPARALERRDYILGRMHRLGYIDADAYLAAINEPDAARLHAPDVAVEAGYAAEMARAEMVERFGEAAYTAGYSVYTTLAAQAQAAAVAAVRAGLSDYDRRHGWRGPEAHVDLAAYPDAAARDALLAARAPVGGLVPALVEAVEDRGARVRLADGAQVALEWDALSWARPFRARNTLGPEPERAADVLAPGDLVRLRHTGEGWELAQIPEVQGALVSLDPDDGAVRALVGGFDFGASKFNRAVQAERQPGSSFKPFIYSAALEKGFTAASVVNDAPVVFDDPGLGGAWRPENYSGRFHGPTRLREALYRSRNLVSVRVLRAIGIDYARTYATQFGFLRRQLPRDLSLALGSCSVSPLALARGYAVFANGGYRVTPYLVAAIEDAEGHVVHLANPARTCSDCDAAEGGANAPPGAEPEADGGAPEPFPALLHGPPPPEPVGPPAPEAAPRVITPQNAWLMNSLLRDVVQRGTGRRARALGRQDLAGKTGTTNDQRDAWFAGFNRGLVAVAWVGFDRVQPLGRRETGGHAALPVWMDYMGTVLEGVPEATLEEPPGLVTVRIDPRSGLLAAAGQEDAIFETFRAEQVPRQVSRADTAGTGSVESGGHEPLF